MGFRSDERAQSTLVGAILLFAILIIAFSSYQAFVVPNQNAEVEFNHNGDVQTDMQELRNSLLDVRSVENGRIVSEHRPVSVRLGTQFPERLVALNPPSPSGTLETEAAESEFRIENATVQGSFDGDPQAELLGSSPNADLRTNFLVYRPEYTEYREPPETVLEHSLLYNDFGDANVTIGEQTVVRPESNRIDIVLYSGNVSRSGSQAVTLDPETLDGPTATVPIESDGGDITVQIPTRSPGVWSDSAAELDGVTLESRTDSSATVSLAANDYTLRVTRVGFDGGETGGPLSDIQPRGGAAAGGNTTFDTSWSSVSAASGSGTAEDPYLVDPDQRVTLTATVLGRDSGLPVDQQPTAFTYAYDVANSNNYNLGLQESTTNASGQDTTTFDVPQSGDSDPGDRIEAYVTAGDDSDVAVFEVTGGPTEFYPDSNSVNAGSLDNFNNIQTEDGSVASFLSGGDPFDIETTTSSVPQGDYILEISVPSGSFQGGGITVSVNGNEETTITGTGLTTVNLSNISGDVTVRYEAGNQNSDIDVDFQRLVVN